jgi:hypothetical protein
MFVFFLFINIYYYKHFVIYRSINLGWGKVILESAFLIDESHEKHPD